MKYIFAGTASTVFVEAFTHALDTINMRAKIINGPKIYAYELIKAEGLLPLFKGIQPILYGYIWSSFVYFTVYANSKIFIKKLLFDNEGK